MTGIPPAHLQLVRGAQSSTEIAGPGVTVSSTQSDYARCSDDVKAQTRALYRDTRPAILGFPLPGFTDDNERARAQATMDNTLAICGQP